MLILSRKENEVIRVGDEVVIRIMQIRGDSVRVGIQAPGDVTVHRQEVWLAIKREEEQGE